MKTFLLPHLLRNAAETAPEKEGFIFRDQTITFSDLEFKSTKLARFLVESGIRKGDRVGLLLKKGLDAIIGIFAILKAGACYVPIDPTVPPARIRYILSLCDIQCLISKTLLDDQILGSPDTSPVKTLFLTQKFNEVHSRMQSPFRICFLEDILQDGDDGPLPKEPNDTYPAYILFTSGTTGMPKGVAISHANSLAFIKMAADFFHVSASDRVSGHAPLSFDLSIFDIFVSVRKRAVSVLVPEFFSAFPLTLNEYLDQHKVSIWNSVPSALSLMLGAEQSRSTLWDTLRLLILSGEVLSPKLVRSIKTSKPEIRVFNVYGQTEANSSLFYEIDRSFDDGMRIPIGKPFPNFEAFALNEKGDLITSKGDCGELFIRGSTVAMGYWKDQERTDVAFLKDPLWPTSSNRVYKTGDMVTLDDDGNYVFIGRKDNLVKSRGYRIEMDEIELTINRCPGVKHSAVIAVPDNVIGNKIIAYVSPESDLTLTEEDVIDHCSRHVPAYMLPAVISFREKLPRTATGKIDRNSLVRDFSNKGT